jgi:hypothetical protein
MTRTPDEYLTEARVKHIYSEAYREESMRVGTTLVEGWILKHTLSIRILQKYREDIIKLLLCLPSGFRVDVKGGGSVSVLIFRDNGTQWTEDMSSVERLIVLGMGVGLVSFNVPDRSRWHKLPGGLPYVRVDITATGVSIN